MMITRDRIFFLLCFCLPFLFVPEALQLHFIGGPIGTQLVIWPTLLMYLYTLWIYLKGEKIFSGANYVLLFLHFILFIICLICSMAFISILIGM